MRALMLVGKLAAVRQQGQYAFGWAGGLCLRHGSEGCICDG
jgi:hypothetical protein